MQRAKYNSRCQPAVLQTPATQRFLFTLHVHVAEVYHVAASYFTWLLATEPEINETGPLLILLLTRSSIVLTRQHLVRAYHWHR